MQEATYSFTIPSLHDDTPLDCRICHPSTLQDTISGTNESIRGAIVGHPYAPLGGSYDDNVVLSVTESLLGQGYIVAIFNFRGAGSSAGKTSWTGRPEIDDFSSVVGLLVNYLKTLKTPSGLDNLSFETGSMRKGSTPSQDSVELLLAGYSFASLILCRLPAVPTILKRFENAENGTAASEIFLRARTLASQTRKSSEAKTQRGRKPSSPTKPHWRNISPPVVLGGEESDPEHRRRSRGDSRGSVEVIRDVSRNIKSHVHRRSGQFHNSNTTASLPNDALREEAEAMTVRYLLISPVLLPLTTTLIPPGLPFTAGEETSGVLSLKYPTLIAFGEKDTFTSSKKLRQWAERLEKEANGGEVKWAQIEGAGHFWRESGAMKELLARIKAWAQKQDGH